MTFIDLCRDLLSPGCILSDGVPTREQHALVACLLAQRLTTFRCLWFTGFIIGSLSFLMEVLASHQPVGVAAVCTLSPKLPTLPLPETQVGVAIPGHYG
ncbi:MAG TPA: hypothetical protein VKK79_04405 [Candidatus Lokiarchaeia archaeon]|nr:hypothetical protein [Candidatus Lokiarchaeia archaeon]